LLHLQTASVLAFSPTTHEERTTHDLGRERKKFIIRQPAIGDKEDYDSENSWISDGLPSSSRRRRRGDGRGELGEWREK